MPLNVDWMVNKMVISCDRILEGGSHCGVVRYKVRYKMLAAPLCYRFFHSQDCQRTTNAPVGAWRGFPVMAMGVLTEYVSLEVMRCCFCATSGATLGYRSIQSPG